MTKKIDILIVEDDPDISGMYEAMLKNFTEYTTLTVRSGEELLDIIDDYKFTLCIMDIQLYGSSYTGVDLSLKLKDKHPDIIIYAMSGYSDVFDGFDPAIAGFSKVFKKPSHFKGLCESIVEDLQK